LAHLEPEDHLSGRRRADQLSICIASSPRTAVAVHLENKTGKQNKRNPIANSPMAIIKYDSVQKGQK